MQKQILESQEQNMHKKPGYVLFLLFSILSVCMTIITLFFARSVTYQHLVHLLTQKDKTAQLAVSASALGQSLLYVPVEDEKKQENKPKNTQENKNDDYNQKLLQQIFPFLYTDTTYKLTEQTEGIKASIDLYVCSEDGKLNINSVYDFAEQKFIKEGQEGDRKKFCQWMFEQISNITKQPSLFDAFEKHIKTKKHGFNDVTELLHIKEFEGAFGNNVFYTSEKTESKKIYLTDLFTVTTEQETINPWYFSHSWRNLLGFNRQKISDETQKKLIESFKKQANWEKDWDSGLRSLYQKEYKDLPKEIKSMLTTECEANIFSLLLSATIGETTSTIFTILKKRTIAKTATFDIVKVYQI